jgi:two-component system, NarL family, response regulator NreC
MCENIYREVLMLTDSEAFMDKRPTQSEMRANIRVLLADDHKIFRAGLRAMIEKEKGMEVVAEAGTGREAIQLAEQLKPDVIVMDVSMPDMNGMEATREIRSLMPCALAIALSMHSERRFVLGMLKAGASGYLLKDCAFGELASAIRHVASGNTYLSPMIAGVVVKAYLNK